MKVESNYPEQKLFQIYFASVEEEFRGWMEFLAQIKQLQENMKTKLYILCKYSLLLSFDIVTFPGHMLTTSNLPFLTISTAAVSDSLIQQLELMLLMITSIKTLPTDKSTRKST